MKEKEGEILRDNQIIINNLNYSNKNYKLIINVDANSFTFNGNFELMHNLC